ncbi:hypothetical protein Tco_1445402 [Tanacetum coccineum]
MGQGSAHGSAPVDDDNSPVEEMSPVNAKKPSKHASKAKKNYSKKKEAPKDWTKAEEIAHDFTLENCYNILKDHQASSGFNLNNEVDAYEEETQVQRPMGRDRSKAKKKSSTSSREGSSSFANLVADKYLGMKSTKWEKMQEQQDAYIQLKN